MDSQKDVIQEVKETVKQVAIETERIEDDLLQTLELVERSLGETKNNLQKAVYQAIDMTTVITLLKHRVKTLKDKL